MNLANELFDFSGKVIIITGAAGAIGSEAARQLAMLGANVALTDINATLAPTSTKKKLRLSQPGSNKRLAVNASVSKLMPLMKVI